MDAGELEDGLTGAFINGLMGIALLNPSYVLLANKNDPNAARIEAGYALLRVLSSAL